MMTFYAAHSPRKYAELVKQINAVFMTPFEKFLSEYWQNFAKKDSITSLGASVTKMRFDKPTFVNQMV